MDFSDEIKALAARIPDILPLINNEAQTRSALVEPFLRILGYDPSNPLEVQPEYGASVKVPGVKQDERLDYALMMDLKPVILIECKACNSDPQKGYGQLFNYFAALEARIGVLTNGVIYKFYADLDYPNKLDEKPFLVLDLDNFQDSTLVELKKLSRQSFVVDDVLTAANELKYTRGIITLLREQLNAPTDDFVKVFYTNLRPGKSFVGKAKEEFIDFTKRALKQFIREEIGELIGRASEIANQSTVQSTSPSDSSNSDSSSEMDGEEGRESRIVTTEMEVEAYHVIKAMLRECIEPARVTYRDTVSYFNILLDDSNRKPICRLYFNNPRSLKIGIFTFGAEGKTEERFAIEDLNDLYQYADRIKNSALSYLGEPQGDSE